MAVKSGKRGASSSKTIAKTWTLDELSALRRDYASDRDELLAERFKTTVDQVVSKARDLALAKNKSVFRYIKMPRWSAADLEYLRAEYPRMTNVEIGRVLGRSSKSVASQASAMGLYKNDDHVKAMAKSSSSMRRGGRRRKSEESSINGSVQSHVDEPPV